MTSNSCSLHLGFALVSAFLRQVDIHNLPMRIAKLLATFKGNNPLLSIVGITFALVTVSKHCFLPFHMHKNIAHAYSKFRWVYNRSKNAFRSTSS